MASSCVFCRIVRGEAPAHVVYQDEAAVAFLDVLPAAPGHTLVVPRAHVEDLYALDNIQAAALMRATVRVAQGIRAALAPAGLSVLQRNGAAAGQTVPHLHVHLVPRRPGDGLGLAMRQSRAAQGELAATAERLRSCMPGG